MSSKHLVLTVMFAAAVGCQDRLADGTEIVDADANDLGIARIEIQHSLVGDDRLLTIRGLDNADQELALATLRTGKVLYSFDADLFPPAWNDGTELTASMGTETFTSVTPDLEAHEATAPYQPELARFVRLRAVAAAIHKEAGIRFAQPSSGPGGEVAFSASACSGSDFPTMIGTAPNQTSGSPAQCCKDGNTSWHKIGSGSNVNKLGWRTYAAACTTSSGSHYCGNPGASQGTCDFGPCGSRNETVSGSNTTAAVFVPTSAPTQCGRDSNGTAANGGIQAPEAFTGAQALYSGVTASCPYISCCYNPQYGESIPSYSASCPGSEDDPCTTGNDCWSGYCRSNGTCAPPNCQLQICDSSDTCCEGVCDTYLRRCVSDIGGGGGEN